MGKVNPIKGVFSLKSEGGFLVKAGKIVKNFLEFTIIGSILDALKSINAVGKSVELSNPTICEKQGQKTTVTYGGPCIRVGKMIVR